MNNNTNPVPRWLAIPLLVVTALALAFAAPVARAAPGTRPAVDKPTAQIVVNSVSPNPASQGQQVTLTFSVLNPVDHPELPAPTGTLTVTVLYASDICSAPVETHTCVFTATVGMQALALRYSGDATYAGSTLMYYGFHCRYPSSVQLTATPQPSQVGQTVVFEVFIGTSSISYNLGGMIYLSVDGVVVAQSGVPKYRRVQFPVSDLTFGTHQVVVSYSGSYECDPSTSAPLTQSVGLELLYLPLVRVKG